MRTLILAAAVTITSCTVPASVTRERVVCPSSLFTKKDKVEFHYEGPLGKIDYVQTGSDEVSGVENMTNAALLATSVDKAISP